MSVLPLPSPRIGHLQLSSPFVQAALSGYSDWAMRALAKRHGASYCIAEVMLDRFVTEVKGSGKTEHYLRVDEGDHPVGAQLMGSDPETFGPAALRLVRSGFDVIDINFGCPVKTAMGGCRGGYHLSQPCVALEIVKRVRDTVPEPIPVTLKMRRGIDNSAVSRDNFFEILDGAFAAGVSAITVHGRTVEQKYRGPSDWSFLRSVKEHVGLRTILGSGDLFTAEDCISMLLQTGVDGVTIARGAIANPWIFQQARRLWQGEPVGEAPTVFQQRDMIQEHRSLIERSYGPGRWLGVLKRFGVRYARFHPQGLAARAEWGQVRTEAAWQSLMERFYGAEQPGRWGYEEAGGEPDSSEGDLTCDSDATAI